MKSRRALWGKVLAPAGLVALLTGLALLLIWKGRLPAGELLLGLGLLLLLAAWWAQPEAVRTFLARRSTRYGGTLALMSLALVGILILVNLLSYGHYLRWDLTAERLYSLSPQSVRLLEQLERPIQVTGFFYSDQRSDELVAIDLLEAYAAHSDLFTYRIVDPEARPALAEASGVQGEEYLLVVESGNGRQTVSTLDERALTGAILRLLWEREVTVYFVVGHGEREAGDEGEEGYHSAAGLLEEAGYRVEPLALAALNETLPLSNTVVVLAGPRASLTAEEEGLLDDYLRRGGRLLALLDPLLSPDLAGILAPWGLEVADTLVIEPRNALAGMDPTIPLHYYAKQGHPISEHLPATFYPGARPVHLLRTRPADLTITPLLGTSDDSWAESDPHTQPMAFDPEKDEAGPLFLAVAVQGRLEQSAQETRLVVVGDSDFASNTYGGSNLTLFLNAVNWLAEEEEVIAISPPVLPERRVYLTAVQGRALRYLTLVGLPLVITAAGLGVWLYRRRR